MTDYTLGDTSIDEQAPASEQQEHSEELDLDTAFDVLKNSDRRRLLGLMDEKSGDFLTERDLAASLVSESRESRRDQETNEQVQQACVKLHHTHLPKLEAAGVFDWDQDRDMITRGPNFEELHSVLEQLDDRAV